MPRKEKDPELPPTSTEPSGPCTRCGRISNFELVGTAPVTFDNSYSLGPSAQQEEGFDEQVAVLRCHGCRQCVVVVEERWVGDHPSREGIGAGGAVTWHGIYWWPAPGSTDLGDVIPTTVREAYAEGFRALSAQAPRAAVVMFRRTLEAVVADKGSPTAKEAADRRNLAAGLQVMADEGALHPHLAEWAKDIRLVGNAGAHYDPVEPVTADDAQDLGRLLRELLNYLYELPAAMSRRRGQQ